MTDITAVILAAGKSTRTYPLTLTKPKALLKILDKTILEHNLEQLDGLVKDVIIVVGYFGEKIKDKIGNKFGNLKIKYIEQKEQRGTGGALLACKSLLKGRFLVLNGDDFYSRKDVEKCLKHQYCILVKKVENPENFGIVDIRNKKALSLEEKPQKPKSNLANIGLYVFDNGVFDHKLEKSKRGEYEITDYVKYLIKQKEVFAETSDFWIPVVYPWNLLDANSFFLSRLKTEIEGHVDQRASISGNAHIGKNTLIKNGVVIEGPVFIGENCTIGPNCYIRSGTVIGNNCRVGNAVEIKNSILGDDVHIAHLSYIGDSILGDKINIGGGTIFANLRFDEKEIQVKINGKLVNTGRKKFGAVLGDYVRIGINCSLMPGILLEPNSTVEPGIALKAK